MYHNSPDSHPAWIPVGPQKLRLKIYPEEERISGLIEYTFRNPFAGSTQTPISNSPSSLSAEPPNSLATTFSTAPVTAPPLLRLSLHANQLDITRIYLPSGQDLDYTYTKLQLPQSIKDSGPIVSLDHPNPLAHLQKQTEAVLTAIQAKDELVITIPEHLLKVELPRGLEQTDESNDQIETSIFTLFIEYSLTKPTIGLHFLSKTTPPIHPPLGSTSPAQLNYFHVVSTHEASGGICSSRNWLPCLESIPCKWEFEYWLHLSSIPLAIHDQVHIVSSGVMTRQFLKDNYKLFQYVLDVATVSGKVGFAAGLFETLKIPSTPFAYAFCPVGLTNRAHPTIEFVSKAFGFCNWFLSTIFPFPSYYLVFVKDGIERPESTFANLSIFTTSLLYDSTIVDQAWETKSILANALSEQYFGIKLKSKTKADDWLIVGLKRFLAELLLRIFHGNNEYKYRLHQDLKRVFHLESKLAPLPPLHSHHHEWYSREGETIEWWTLKARLVLVLMQGRMDKGTTSVFQKLLTHLWSEATTNTNASNYSSTSTQVNGADVRTDDKPRSSQKLVDGLSTGLFLKAVKRMTGKDWKAFADNWIYGSGCPKISCSFTINRRKSLLEVEISQTTPGYEQKKFVGTVLIRVHETDGVFDHSVHIDDYTHHLELPVHSKVRKARRKRKDGGHNLNLDGSIAIQPDDFDSVTNPVNMEGGLTTSAATGIEEEVVCWLRIDPEMEWLASCELVQPDFMWQSQLENDRDVISQSEALYNLVLSSEYTDLDARITSRLQNNYEALLEGFEKVIQENKMFWRVRRDACLSIAQLSAYTGNYHYIYRLFELFGEKYGTNLKSDDQQHQYHTHQYKHHFYPHLDFKVIPSPNNFDPSLSNYFVKKAIIEAIENWASIINIASQLNQASPSSTSPIDKSIFQIPLFDAAKFLIGLLFFNDNSQNSFSDGYYLAAIIDALGTVMEKLIKAGLISMNHNNSKCKQIESNSSTAVLIGSSTMEELERYERLERICPYFRNVVMCAILRARQRLAVAQTSILQDTCLVPNVETDMEYYTISGHGLDVRRIALEGISLDQLNKIMLQTSCQWLKRQIINLLGTRTLLVEEKVSKSEYNQSLNQLLQSHQQVWLRLVQECEDPLLLKLLVTRLKEMYKTIIAELKVNTEDKVDDDVSTNNGLKKITLNIGAIDKYDAKAAPTGTPGLYETYDSDKDDEGQLEETADWMNEIEQDLGFRNTAKKKRKRDNLNIPLLSNVPKIRLAIGSSGPGENKSNVQNYLDSLKIIEEGLFNVFEAIWNSYDSYAFRQPVDRSVPGYYEVIKEPIDLTTIKKRLKGSIEDLRNSKGEIDASNLKHIIVKFVQNLLKMFKNCYQFNQPDSMICDQARRLEKYCLKELKRTFPTEAKLIKRLMRGEEEVNLATPVKEAEKPPVLPKLVLSTNSGLKKKPNKEKQFVNISNNNQSTLIDSNDNQGRIKRVEEVMEVDNRKEHVNNKVVPSVKLKLNLGNIISVEKSYVSSTLSLTPINDDNEEMDTNQKAPEFIDQCKLIIDRLMKHNLAGPFLHPVDPIKEGVPNYPQVIKNPMDLGTIYQRLVNDHASNHFYTTSAQVKKDLDQCWQNCWTFNGRKSQIGRWASALSEETENLWKQFLIN